MEFTSQICTTKEQSERLLALGLNTETADMGLIGNIPIVLATTWANADPLFDIPAWSLDRLIEMLRDSETPEDYKVDFYVGLNRYDEIIALIQSLIHIGGFNKEYLNECGTKIKYYGYFGSFEFTSLFDSIMNRLLVKNKPHDKVTLITDAMRAKHMADGEYELGGQPVFVKNGEARLAGGTLAGSVLKMNNAVKNIIKDNIRNIKDK